MSSFQICLSVGHLQNPDKSVRVNALDKQTAGVQSKLQSIGTGLSHPIVESNSLANTLTRKCTARASQESSSIRHHMSTDRIQDKVNLAVRGSIQSSFTSW